MENRPVKYCPRNLVAAWDLLLRQDSVTTDAMAIDLIWVGRQLLGDLFLVEKQQMDKAFEQGDTAAVNRHANLLLDLMIDLDQLNGQHRQSTLHTWLQQARDLGSTPEVKDYYEMNARRLITTWGGSLNDYACRNWSGLIDAYYSHRWMFYIQEMYGALYWQRPFDEMNVREQIDTFQQEWVDIMRDYAKLEPAGLDILAHSRLLRDKYRQQLDAWIMSGTE